MMIAKRPCHLCCAIWVLSSFFFILHKMQLRKNQLISLYQSFS
uniref:Uncharacterized protein n=1 Tax=Setaria italica TaxID=4555 RepID=K3Z281_SETIT